MTEYGGSILRPIARLFGYIINAIYNFFENVVGIENVNVGFIIIVFTFVVYILMFPLTYQQQKFSNLQKLIQPELKKIQEKYKNKKDQASMLKQQEETQALYDKYGISMSGSCVQMLIQLPILYALFGVFNNLPAYIDSVRNIFGDLVTKIQALPDYQDKMQTLYEGMNNSRVRVDFFQEGATSTDLGNYIIDVLYKLSEDGWTNLTQTFPDFSLIIDNAHQKLQSINYFFVLNISDSPLNTIKSAWGIKSYGIILAALLIPVLSYLSQVVNIKVAQIGSNVNSNDQMASQMQAMNRVMPLMSLFFTFSVPIGLGLYWISGAVIRSILMVALNKHFSKMDLQKLIEKNKDKAEAKRKKRNARYSNITSAATMNTKKTLAQKAEVKSQDNITDSSNSGYVRENLKEGSMASKANLVAEFNNKNNRK